MVIWKIEAWTPQTLRTDFFSGSLCPVVTLGNSSVCFLNCLSARCGGLEPSSWSDRDYKDRPHFSFSLSPTACSWGSSDCVIVGSLPTMQISLRWLGEMVLYKQNWTEFGGREGKHEKNPHIHTYSWFRSTKKMEYLRKPHPNFM